MLHSGSLAGKNLPNENPTLTNGMNDSQHNKMHTMWGHNDHGRHASKCSTFALSLLPDFGVIRPLLVKTVGPARSSHPLKLQTIGLVEQMNANQGQRTSLTKIHQFHLNSNRAFQQ
jgi:hypothetical protein